MIIGVRKWAVCVGLATIAAGFCGALIGGWKKSQPSPMPPPPCNDAAGLIDETVHVLNCNPGERMETEHIGNHVLIKCFCPAVHR